MRGPILTKLAQSLPSTVPFVGPEAQERARGRPFIARLGANENVFGPSPSAIEAMRAAAEDVWMYGDPESHDLRHALARHHGVDPTNIIIGEGIDGLLGYLVRLLVEAGDTVVTSAGAYPTFNYHVAGYGGVLHTCPYLDDAEDLPNLLSTAERIGAKLVYFANPDNPMGSWHKGAAIDAAIANIPDGCVLLLDEAYVEFADTDAIPKLDVANPSVIRMRTFSKAYGMAGGRVGYAIGHSDLIQAFDKVRNHFGMCRISQAGALAALADQAWLAATVENVKRAREKIARIAQDNGLKALPSATNFVAIDCMQDGAFARAVMAALVERDIFVRMPGIAPLDRCIRISAGRDTDLQELADALPAALAAAEKSKS